MLAGRLAASTSAAENLLVIMTGTLDHPYRRRNPMPPPDRTTSRNKIGPGVARGRAQL